MQDTLMIRKFLGKKPERTYRMWTRLIYFFIFSSFFFPLAFANCFSNCIPDCLYNRYWRPVLIFSGGTAFTSDPGVSKNFPPQDGIINFYDYAVNRGNQTRFIWGSFLGGEFLINDTWTVQAGVGYYRPSTFHIHGFVTQGTSALLQNTFRYNYAIESAQYLVESKVLYNLYGYHLYLIAGIGTARNYTSKFSVIIPNPQTITSPIFQNNTSFPFTYEIGAGIDVSIADHMRLGLGYRFTDLGSSKTGSAFIKQVVTNYTLSQSHLYVNEILAQVTLILI